MVCSTSIGQTNAGVKKQITVTSQSNMQLFVKPICLKPARPTLRFLPPYFQITTHLPSVHQQAFIANSKQGRVHRNVLVTFSIDPIGYAL